MILTTPKVMVVRCVFMLTVLKHQQNIPQNMEHCHGNTIYRLSISVVKVICKYYLRLSLIDDSAQSIISICIYVA